ncbi:MAG: sortase [Chloroflexota bacterium]|nr:MAG: sortase [Chloroflexota bacterium]
MAFRDHLRLPARLAIALVLAVVAAVPAPSLAASPTGRPAAEAAATRDLEAGAGVRGSGGPDGVGVSAPVAVAVSIEVDLRLGQIRPFIVARIAAERAAAEAAAAEAAAQAAAAEAAAAKAAAQQAAAPAHSGTNHFWIPSLGLSRSVETFACSRSTPPANQVYRWGCAGANNVYIFGHAWGVMKPLHDAYVSGRLEVGMTALYADGKGHVRTYRVTEFRVVTPDQVDWAIAAQSAPSMTLQTCVGANSDRRLLVRLVAD